MKQKIKTFLAVIILILVFSMLAVSETQAGAGESGRGWLWDGSDDGGIPAINTGVGWISMNSANCDKDFNGINDACDINNDGLINITDFIGVGNYGVNIPASDGALSGYAWSENIGWVGFNPADIAGCPNGSCTAQRIGNNLAGWARITGIANAAAAGNSGGWQGWIKLSGTAQDGSPYGISINPADGKLTGYGWSDELGWIDFSRAFTDATPPTFSCIPPAPSAASATLCTGDDTGLSANTNNSVVDSVGSCGAPKCEYYCNAGYTKVGNNCIICEDICNFPPTCTSDNCEDSITPNCTNTCTLLPCVTNDCANITCPDCPTPSGNWIEVAP